MKHGEQGFGPLKIRNQIIWKAFNYGLLGECRLKIWTDMVKNVSVFEKIRENKLLKHMQRVQCQRVCCLVHPEKKESCRQGLRWLDELVKDGECELLVECSQNLANMILHWVNE